MMDRERAAQYFVVAWVKDWTLGTYMHVIADGGPAISVAEAHALFPWLPGPWTFMNRSLTCRVYLAESNRVLSNALWDAGNDSARLLALAPQVEAFTFKERSRSYVTEARTPANRSSRDLKLARLLRAEAVDTVDRMNGHHWQVCK